MRCRNKDCYIFSAQDLPTGRGEKIFQAPRNLKALAAIVGLAVYWIIIVVTLYYMTRGKR